MHSCEIHINSKQNNIFIFSLRNNVIEFASRNTQRLYSIPHRNKALHQSNHYKRYMVRNCFKGELLVWSSWKYMPFGRSCKPISCLNDHFILKDLYYDYSSIRYGYDYFGLIIFYDIGTKNCKKVSLIYQIINI